MMYRAQVWAVDALMRVRRGYARMWAFIVRKITRRRSVTEYQQETARETRVALGLMADAAEAGADMSDEQRMFLAQSAPGMRARETVLLSIPNRSLVEENELLMIRRWMARIEGRDAPVSQPTAIRGLLGASGGALAAFGGVRLWMVLAAGWALTGGALAVQSALKERIEDQRDRARNELREARNTIEHYRDRETEYRAALSEAEEDRNEAIARTMREREIAERARAQARRARLELETATRDRGEPIDWGLPVAGTAEGDAESAPPSGDAGPG